MEGTRQHPEASDSGVPLPLLSLQGQGEQVVTEPRGHEEKASWQQCWPSREELRTRTVPLYLRPSLKGPVSTSHLPNPMGSQRDRSPRSTLGPRAGERRVEIGCVEASRLHLAH